MTISKLLAALSLTWACFAQHGEHASASDRPAALLAGMGNGHHPIATANPEAQKFFDQGLMLAYGFNHDEAVRSFRRAAELDPRAAMPQWGIALALGPNYNMPLDPERAKLAYEALEKARALAAAAPENERAYVNALAKRYSEDPKADRKKLDLEYAHAMKALKDTYPDDPDAATLYAESLMDLRPWQLWSADGRPAEGTDEIVAVLTGVLRTDPNHIGANHYFIHAIEASKTPERALASADRLAMLAPAAGHLVHMPGHIYLQLGDYETAARTNDAAAEADRAYIRKTGAQGVYPLMYYSHNLHFILTARAAEGRYNDAMKAAAQLRENVAPAVRTMAMVEPFYMMPEFVMLRFGKWDEILKAREPEASGAIVTALRHFARGAALAGKGDVKSAERERSEFETARKAIPAEAHFGINKAAPVFELASLELEARIQSAQGNREAAFKKWRAAAEAQDALGYDEPPSWYHPVRESLGGALLRDGRAAEAERVFREDLAKNPRNGRSLFGLLESLKAQKKPGTEWVAREFEAAWKNADHALKAEDL